MTVEDLSAKRKRAGAKGGRAKARNRNPIRPEHMNFARPVAELRAGRTDWFKMSVKDDTAVIDIYDEIGYWGVTAKDFTADLRDLDVENIHINLNSYGGDVFDGVAIYNELVNHPANITIEITGIAASIASVIAMAGDEIRIGKNAQMMIHEAWGMAIGNAAEMRQTADLLDKIGGTIAETYADRAGGTVEGWREAMLAETWYTGAEAVEAGLADVVMERSGTSEDDAPVFDLTVYKYASRTDAPDPYIPADVVEPQPEAVAEATNPVEANAKTGFNPNAVKAIFTALGG